MPKEHVVVGRQSELEIVEECAGTPMPILVRGGAGMGKTTLLGAIQRAWRARGINVLRLDCSDALPRWDEFGTQVVIEAIRDGFHEIGDSRVAAAVAAVSRSSAPEAYGSSLTRSALFAGLVHLFQCLRANGPVAVLADDVHAAPNPELAVAAACQAGCTVVAACREDGLTAEPTSFGVVASRVLDLAPLSDDQIDEMLAAAVPDRLDESVPLAIRAALGTLAGNPGTVMGTFEKLKQGGRFTEVQGHLCLSDPTAPMALPADHHLVRQVARFGVPGAQLVALVEATDRFCVDDLLTFAAATGRELAYCGQMVDDLVAAGVLDYDDDDLLSIPCPALAGTVLDELRPADTASLHRAIAEHLLRDKDALLPEPAVVADHIALAGAAMRPDPAVLPLLESEAARVRHVNPVLAARWYQAALRHCPPEGVARERLLRTVLRLLVRAGHYRRLGEVVAEAVATGTGDALHYDLAASAALAAVHTGVPVPPAVHNALAAGTRSRGPLEFAAAWFAGRESFTGEELEAAFGAFLEDGPIGFERTEVIEVAGDQDDVVTLVKLFLGGTGGAPAHGPVAIFGRIVRDFAKGDWNRVPSEVRQLELAGSTETALHRGARLLAAEVLASMGEFGSATGWLERAGAADAFPAARAWAEIGIAYRSGDWEGARTRGWAAYGEIAAKAEKGPYVGLRAFLVRLAYLEQQAGNTEKLRVLCEDGKRWYARHGGMSLRITQLVLRGLAERDYAAATEAVEILRKQDNLGELMRALMTVAFLADEPHPWYHEAYEIARRLGGDWMRLNIKGAMRDSGVSAPSHRVRREALTETEERVIGLVRQGLTNRQIAAAVQISENTVENHLTRLFVKTGCRSRLELAAASLDGRLAVVAPGDRVS